MSEDFTAGLATKQEASNKYVYIILVGYVPTLQFVFHFGLFCHFFKGDEI